MLAHIGQQLSEGARTHSMIGGLEACTVDGIFVVLQ